MRRENIYKSETSSQEFISKSFMRRELYKRIKLAHDYMVLADNQYCKGIADLSDFMHDVHFRITELKAYIALAEDALIISPEESDCFDVFIDKCISAIIEYCEYFYVKEIFTMETFDILLSPVSEG